MGVARSLWIQLKGKVEGHEVWADLVEDPQDPLVSITVTLCHVKCGPHPPSSWFDVDKGRGQDNDQIFL